MVPENDSLHELAAANRRLADFAAALDWLGGLSGQLSESQLVEKIFELFSQLCRPASLAYLSCDPGRPQRVYARQERPEPRAGLKERLASVTESYRLTASGQGFALNIHYKKKRIGVLEIDFIAAPEQIDHCLGLSQAIESVLALALANSRYYRNLKQAQQTLRQERDRAQKYLDVAGVINIIIDEEEQVRQVNKMGCKILGLPEEEIVNRNWFDHFVSPAARTESRIIFRRLLAGELKAVSYFEQPVLTAQGIKIIAWHSTALDREAGGPPGMLSSGEDITQRRQAELALKKREEQLEAQYRGIPIPTTTWQRQGGEFVLIDCNAATEALSPNGLTTDQWRRQAAEIFANYPDFMQCLQRCWRQKQLVRHELDYRFDNSNSLSFACTFAFVPPDLVMVHAEDITEQKRIDELSRALSNINATIRSTLDLDQIMQAVVTQAAAVMGAATVRIALKEQREWVVSYISDLDQGIVGSVLPPEEIPHITLAARKKTAVILNERNRLRRLNQPHDVGSLLAVPLMVRDEVIGALAFDYSAPVTTNDKLQLDFAGQLAASVSLAIENARLYQNELATRLRAESYADQLSVLHNIGLSLNRETDQNKLLELVLEGAATLTSAGVGITTLVDEEQVSLASVYYAPWHQEHCALSDQPLFHQQIPLLMAEQERDVIRLDGQTSLGCFNLPAGHLQLRGLLVGTLRNLLGQVKGYFLLSNKRDGSDFTEADEEIIALLAAQSSVALASAENFEKEHHISLTLQRSLLTPPPYHRRDLEIGLFYRSADSHGKVGGDFYDFVELEGDKLAIVVGDVCGKGIEAATYTAMIKYSLRAHLEDGKSPGECLAKLNATIYKRVSPERFVTIGLVIIDNQSGVVSYSCAGHPPAIVCYDDLAHPLYLPSSLPLGVLPDHTFPYSEISVNHDYSLLLYTDGLSEARPRDGQPLGQKRVLEAALNSASLPPQQIANALLELALDYSENHLRDDIALVVARIARPGRGERRAEKQRTLPRRVAANLNAVRRQTNTYH